MAKLASTNIFGDLTVSRDATVGGIQSSGLSRFTGAVDQTALGIDRIDIGVQGGTPRMVFEDAEGTTTWMIDNAGGTFRWFTPGIVRMSLSSTGNLNVSGTGTGLDFIATSDIRLKDNIAPLNNNDCLDQINQLVPSSFTWKESGEEDTGLIAQQVQEVLPERVKGDDQLAISYAKLTTHLIGAVQALTEQNKKLQEQINVITENNTRE